MSHSVVDKAKRAIAEVFEDTNVPKSETESRLRELRDEIDVLLDALR